MLSPAFRQALEQAIAQATGHPFRIHGSDPASGGCIHSSWVLEDGGVRYFAKVNEARLADSLAAEADGLIALDRAGMRVPRPITQGVAEGQAYLVLEYLPLGAGQAASFRALGGELAHLHDHSGPTFGWHCDNFIGLTPQRNTVSSSWADFWQRERIAPQLELAARNGHRGELQASGERLLDTIPRILAGHRPTPSLLHGDLWSGNAGFLANGAPVVFDPAVYYGDAEADLAMTELFGGFPPAFYEGYRAARPVSDGYRVRCTLYNLYHVLNHLNLFGAGYRAQAERMMKRLLAEVG
jgi:protein-ribulosamine 3-kinase